MDPDYQIVKGQTLRNLTLGRPSQGPDKLYNIFTSASPGAFLPNAQLFIQPWFRVSQKSQLWYRIHFIIASPCEQVDVSLLKHISRWKGRRFRWFSLSTEPLTGPCPFVMVVKAGNINPFSLCPALVQCSCGLDKAQSNAFNQKCKTW